MQFNQNQSLPKIGRTVHSDLAQFSCDIKLKKKGGGGGGNNVTC